MGVRELIENQKHWVLPAAVVWIVACTYAGWRTYRSGEIPGIVERAYFTDDDGKTYFADDVKQGFSFDHGGKTAYRAFVYRSGSGKTFVGLLARTGETSTAKVSAPLNSGRKGQGGPPAPMEVKKPGENKWVSSLSSEYQPLLKTICPGENPDVVLP